MSIYIHNITIYRIKSINIAYIELLAEGCFESSLALVQNNKLLVEYYFTPSY